MAAALAVAGVFNLALSVVAAGTAAGTPIENTATATYEDGNGTTINATSNTVTINVAEIAGLVAVPDGIVDNNGGAVEANDVLVFSFEVTNTGNDETDVFIPGINDITTQNLATVTQVEIFDATGTTSLGVVPAAGGNYATINAGGLNGGINLPADGVFIVRVTGTADPASGAGNPVGVTLGNTAPNDNSAATQNQPFTDDGANNDLNTIDVGPTAPTNGDREASAIQDIPFASANNPLALATILKTSAVVNNDAAVTTDDQITYNLELQVENTDPSNTFQPASLEGTTIQLDGNPEERILVSDAIPAGTVLESVGTAPAGWTAVFTTDALAGSDPLAVAWTTTAPVDLTTVTRVGFVNSSSIAAGGSATGFNFTVLTSGLPAAGGSVDNIAQVFGQTVGDPTDEVVYDESGDQNPNNFNDDGTLPDATGTNYTPGTDDGVADPADGIDAGNDNTGTDPAGGVPGGGEVNQVTIVPANDDILNGPNATPGAVGPTDDNDDFTNQSTAVPTGVQSGTAFDPAAVTFTNTVNNPAAGGFLSNVTLQPVSPTQAEGADGNATTGQYGANGDIPDGTVVTITFDPGTGPVSAAYTYNAGTFTTADTPINVGNVPAGASVNYTVAVDLPGTVTTLDEVGIPIIAFPDDDPVGSPGFNGEVTNNITIDRLYTGFVSLIKEARVLDATGTERLPFTQNFVAADAIAPGEFIEYRISYANISTPNAGTGNVPLTATNFVLTEDGTGAGTATGNNWAATTTHQQNTVATTGTVDYTDVTGPTTVNADPVSGTKVDIYVNNVGNIIPSANGSLTFRRIVD
ncbi:MAG: hypothetical protein AAFR58_02710 [Cyanobacteria bacterium J06627_28]